MIKKIGGKNWLTELANAIDEASNGDTIACETENQAQLARIAWKRSRNDIELTILKKEDRLEKTAPYIEETSTNIRRRYNPDYGDYRICTCGHQYLRHFDSYENMRKVGCKYCPCFNFVEEKPGDK